MGGRRARLATPTSVLPGGHGERECRQQGVHGQQGGRRRADPGSDRSLFGLAIGTFDFFEMSTAAFEHSESLGRSPLSEGHSSSSGRWGRAPSSRFTSGCPTPWPGPTPVSALMHAATMVMDARQEQRSERLFVGEAFPDSGGRPLRTPLAGRLFEEAHQRLDPALKPDDRGIDARSLSRNRREAREEREVAAADDGARAVLRKLRRFMVLSDQVRAMSPLPIPLRSAR